MKLSVVAISLVFVGAMAFYFMRADESAFVGGDIGHWSTQALVKRAEKGEAFFQRALARRYLDGDRAEKNPELAIQWLQKAASQNHVPAQNSLGIVYLEGRAGDKDVTEALRWFERAASNGSASAASNLALVYQQGKGVDVDYLKAVEWYEAALKLGDIESAYYLGKMYRDGEGVEADPHRAIEYFQKGIDRGDGLSYSGLGMMYQYGLGVEKDMHKAGELREAAAQRKPERFSEYIESIKKECHKFFNEDSCLFSAGAGDAEAMRIIGLAYHNGQGHLQKDNQKMIEWFEKAARAGSAEAQLQLATTYLNGDGKDVPRDLMQAYAWFSVAMTAGQWTAAQKQSLDAAMLSAYQGLAAESQAAAKARAAEYISKYGHH